MKIRRLTTLAGAIVSICALSALSPRSGAQNLEKGAVRAGAVPFKTTRCDVSIPIHIELVPLNRPQVGQVAQFSVEAGSALDPDLVLNSWVEYELPARMRRAGRPAGAREVLGKVRSSRSQLEVVVPDALRYEVRARYVVQLTNGRTIAQTAVRHINIGAVPPEGMIGRIVDSDGNGIRVFRGATVRN